MTTPTEALRLARDALELAYLYEMNWPDAVLSAYKSAIAAMDALAQQHATDIDEAQLARLHAIGAVAWAGVDPQALRDGWQASLPADMRDAFEHWTATQCSDCTNYTIWKAACAWVLQQPSVHSAEPAAWIESLKIDMQHSAWEGVLQLDDALRNIDDAAKAWGAAPLMANGLTEAETRATASVAGLTPQEPAARWCAVHQHYKPCEHTRETAQTASALHTAIRLVLEATPDQLPLALDALRDMTPNVGAKAPT